MTRAHLYARFSSELQDARSIGDQLTDLRAYAEKKGWRVAAVHTDAAISGSTMIRPGLQAAMAAAAAGACDVILAEALDRISRDLGDTAQIFKQLSFNQVKLHTIAEGDVVKMHVALKGLMNDEFLVALAGKIKRGMRGNIERGLAAAGISYGYEAVRELDAKGELLRGRRKIREDQAAIVREIFAAYTAGVSPLTIAAELNARRVAPPGQSRSEGWTVGAIVGNKARGVGILHNELYIGQLVFNRTRKVKEPTSGRELIRTNPKHEWQRQTVEQLRIVDDKTWNAAQARKALRAPATASPEAAAAIAAKRRAPHFLCGIVHCAQCGSAFISRSAALMVCSKAHAGAGCGNNRRVRKADLEGAVLAEIQTLLSKPASYAAAAKRYHENMARDETDRQKQRRALTKELGDIRGKIARLVAAIADAGAGAPGAIIRQIGELEAREQDITARLAEDPAPTVTLHPKAHEIYAAKVAGLAEAIGPTAAPAVRARAQALLRALIDRIDITPTAQEPNRPGYAWELTGKLRKFFTLAEGGDTSIAGENDPGTRWGSAVVRVAGIMR